MQDLFGEQRVEIKGNPKLELTANHILKLVKEDPDLLNGDKMKEIDRKLRQAVWRDNGLTAVLGDKLEAFEEWASDSNRCIDPEIIQRARRHLIQHDLIRVSAEAVRDAEKMRQRVSGSLGR